MFLPNSFSETIVFPFLTTSLGLYLVVCAWESESHVILIVCTVKSPQIPTLNSLDSEPRSRQSLLAFAPMKSAHVLFVEIFVEFPGSTLYFVMLEQKCTLDKAIQNILLRRQEKMNWSLRI